MELDRPETPFSHNLQQPVGTEATVEEVIERAFSLREDDQIELLCAMAAHIVPRLEEVNARSFIESLKRVPEGHEELAPPEDTGVWGGSVQGVLGDVLRQAMGAQAVVLHRLGTRIVGVRSDKERQGLLDRIQIAIDTAVRGETPEGEAFQAQRQRRVSGVPSRHEGRASTSHANFLKRIEAHTGLSRLDAEVTAVATLCALDRRLQADEAKDFDSQLPATFQALLQRCHVHKGEKPRKVHRDAFLRNIAEDIGCDVSEAESRVLGVFAALRDQLTEGEVEDVVDQLPLDFKELFRRLS